MVSFNKISFKKITQAKTLVIILDKSILKI